MLDLANKKDYNIVKNKGKGIKRGTKKRKLMIPA